MNSGQTDSVKTETYKWKLGLASWEVYAFMFPYLPRPTLIGIGLDLDEFPMDMGYKMILSTQHL